MEAENIQAIRNWAKENRPDCLVHIENIIEKESQNDPPAKALLLLLTICFEAGRSSIPAKQPKKPSQPSLVLTVENYWQEIGNQKNLPIKLVGLVRELINCKFRNLIPPRATPDLIALAKKHLSEGIQLNEHTLVRRYSIVLVRRYSIVVYMPDKNHRTAYRAFFHLIPFYSGEELKQLDEL